MPMRPFRFDIRTPNTAAATQAGMRLGEGMRRNRIEEMRYQAEQRQAAADRQAKIDALDAQTREDILNQTAMAYYVASQETDPAKRDAIIAGHRDQMAAIHGPDSVVDFTPTYVEEEAIALRPRMPQAEAPDLPASIRETLWLETATPEQRQLFEAAQRAGASQVIVGGQGGVTDRPLTPEEATRFGIGDDEVDQFIIREGALKRREETAGEREASQLRAANAKAAQVLRPVQSALNRYRNLLSKTGAEVTGLFGQGADLEAAYRDAQLALKEAANLGVLSGPDLELLESVMPPPTGFGAKAAEIWARATQDPNDLPTYESALNRQIEAVGSRIAELEGDGAAQTTPLPPPSPGPTRRRVESDLPSPKTQAEYDAIPSGSRYQHPDDPPGTYRTKN